MKRFTMQRLGENLIWFLIPLFTFFLPISPSVKSIFLVGSLIVIVLTPYYRRHILNAFNTLWGWSALGLFSFVVIACFWSQAPFSMQEMIIGKYLKLLYIPLLAVCFIRPELRILCLHSYLAAILLTCIISILKSNGIILTGDPGEVFYNHIITGFMVAMGSYLAGLFALRSKGWLRIGYLMMVLITSYQVLFVNTGRTGYVVYFIVMALLLLQHLPLKKACIGVLLFCGLMTIVYHESVIMQVGVKHLISDIQSLQQNKGNTSLGFRMQFHDYAKSLWATHSLIGIGTGGFKFSFLNDNPVPSWGPELTDPHSQYWMTLAEQGVVGLLLLLFFLSSLFITSFKLEETRPILLAILVAFSIGSFSDTILCYSTAGFLLVLMSALCFGELIEKQLVKSNGTEKMINLGWA